MQSVDERRRKQLPCIPKLMEYIDAHFLHIGHKSRICGTDSLESHRRRSSEACTWMVVGVGSSGVGPEVHAASELIERAILTAAKRNHLVQGTVKLRMWLPHQERQCRGMSPKSVDSWYNRVWNARNQQVKHIDTRALV